MKRLFYIVILLMVLVSSCKESKPQDTTAPVPRDRSVNASNSHSELFFDSLQLEQFLAVHKLRDTMANRIRSFYNSRNYQYAWFFKEGIADYAPAFLQMQGNYIAFSGDSVLNNAQLAQVVDSISTFRDSIVLADSTKLLTELALTRQFFRYANRAYQGRGDIDAKDLEWYIPRKKINSITLLDSLLKYRGRKVAEFEPVHRQYNLLKDYLVKYYELEKKGGWTPIQADKKIYKEGDSATAIIAIKKRLQVVGDLPGDDTTKVFDKAMTEGVKRFQRRYGFSETGTVNSKLITELNRPITQRIHQVLLNMERIRWVPAPPETDYLLVNVPEFRLHAYKAGNYEFSMNVVVGSTVHNTVIFSGTLKHVVFSPYWYVPASIFRKEVQPGIKRNPNYLASHNMELYGGTARQKPGKNNALGLVKFLFPNSYNIYLHDTPSKSLFKEDQRAFSHGCIRLAEPKKLAQFLLRNDKNWDSASITKAMNSGNEKYVVVKETVPVYIGYFTAWVDREGKLNFRDDIYGHDKNLASHLFSNKTAGTSK